MDRHATLVCGPEFEAMAHAHLVRTPTRLTDGYENAQKRIWKFSLNGRRPPISRSSCSVIRVGDWGGYMMLDCDDAAAVNKFCSLLPAFVFEARPVIPIEDAVRVELESIAFRDGLEAK